MTAALKAVRVLQDGEAAVVHRERASGRLRLVPYFVGKVAAELPLNLALPLLLTAVTHRMAGLRGPLPQMSLLFALETVAANALGYAVGASSPSLDVGLEASKALMTISTVFGGLYFDQSTLPWALRWVPSTSLVRRAWDGAVCYELGAIGTLGVVGLPTTEQMLAEHGVHGRAAEEAAWALALIASLLYTLAFCALAVRGPRFQTLRGGGGDSPASATRCKSE